MLPRREQGASVRRNFDGNGRYRSNEGAEGQKRVGTREDAASFFLCKGDTRHLRAIRFGLQNDRLRDAMQKYLPSDVYRCVQHSDLQVHAQHQIAVPLLPTKSATTVRCCWLAGASPTVGHQLIQEQRESGSAIGDQSTQEQRERAVEQYRAVKTGSIGHPRLHCSNRCELRIAVKSKRTD